MVWEGAIEAKTAVAIPSPCTQRVHQAVLDGKLVIDRWRQN